MAAHTMRACGLLLVLLSTVPFAAAVRGRRGMSMQRQPKGTTPVKKVLELLKDLSAKVEADGKREAAQYDKFACFCKEQADEKLYSIERSTAKIDALKASAEELQTDTAQLTRDISALGEQITAKETLLDNATVTRKSTNDQYRASYKEVTSAIAATESALAEMQGGKTPSAPAAILAQLQAVTAELDLSEEQRRALSHQPAYEYHSNDVITVIENLLKVLRDSKERLYQEEFASNSAFEERKVGLEAERRNLVKEKREKVKLEAAKTEQLQGVNRDRNAEKKAMTADQAFMKELRTQCEEKARDWDARSRTRSNEVTAITKAIDSLEAGAVPRGQSALQRPVPALLQLRGGSQGEASTDSDRAPARRKALLLLDEAADRLHSGLLSVVALRVRNSGSADYFVKVRSIIKDIVARLQAQADAEATTKSFCDKGVQRAVTARDAKAEELEGLNGQISEKKAQVKKLGEEIAALAKGIADNAKALQEASELRAQEKSNSDSVKSSSDTGKQAVEYAISVLRDFYGGSPPTVAPELAQVGARYVPADADRAGNTVGDLAPEMYDSGYGGQTESSNSIIGMLEVILADFDRAGTKATDQDSAAAEQYDDFVSANEADTTAKQSEKKAKEDESATLSDEIVTLQDSKKDAVAAKDLAEQELSELRSMCIDGEETYEQRVAKREKEIAALKEAHDVLENWQQR